MATGEKKIIATSIIIFGLIISPVYAVSSLDNQFLSQYKYEVDFARDVYSRNESDLNNPGGNKFHGWTITNIERDDDTGFVAVTYMNTDLTPPRAIIAFAGTECGTGSGAIACLKDVYVDSFLVNKYENVQQAQARRYVEKFLRSPGNSNLNLMLTGHSLGGGLAQYAALANGVAAVTFNAAPVRMTIERSQNFTNKAWAITANSIYNIRSAEDVMSVVNEEYKQKTGVNVSYGNERYITNFGTHSIEPMYDYISKIDTENQRNPSPAPSPTCTTATCPNTPTTPIPSTTPLIWAGQLSGAKGNPSGANTMITFDGAISASSVVNNQPVTIIPNTASGISGTATAVPGEYIRSGYQYTAWGEWNGNITASYPGMPTVTGITHGHWVLGNPTQDSPSVRALGSATYNGQLRGDHVASNGVLTTNIIGGTMNMNVNFSTMMLGANLNITKNGSAWVNTSVNNVQIQSMPYNGANYFGFNGLNNGPGGSISSVVGTFYGPQAQEAGGSWQYATGNGENASGVFRAKR